VTALLKTPAVEVPPWIAVALAEVGVLEDTRAGKSTTRIEQYHAVTRGGRAVDDVPWCAAFVCFCLEQCGILSTRSKTAATFASYGIATLPTRQFAIVGFGKVDKDAGGSGHVAFSLGASAGELYILGGNQRNRVSVATRLVKDVAWARWPVIAEVA